MTNWPMDEIAQEHYRAKCESSLSLPMLSDERIEQYSKESSAYVLNYLKTALNRLESGERTKGIPEYMAESAISGIKSRIKELEGIEK